MAEYLAGYEMLHNSKLLLSFVCIFAGFMPQESMVELRIA